MMTTELIVFFHDTVEILMKGGLSEVVADQLLTHLINEACCCMEVMDEKDVSVNSAVSLSDREYEFC